MNTRTQLEQRIKQLKNEFQVGQKMLAELQTKEADLCETLLRITGAIQVLVEELAKDSQRVENGASQFDHTKVESVAMPEQNTLS
ncbi:hypothetical protein KJ068_06845 [bacterium]|nr:hypothetical protein [bacterium]